MISAMSLGTPKPKILPILQDFHKLDSSSPEKFLELIRIKYSKALRNVIISRKCRVFPKKLYFQYYLSPHMPPCPPNKIQGKRVKNLSIGLPEDISTQDSNPWIILRKWLGKIKNLKALEKLTITCYPKPGFNTKADEKDLCHVLKNLPILHKISINFRSSRKMEEQQPISWIENIHQVFKHFHTLDDLRIVFPHYLLPSEKFLSLCKHQHRHKNLNTLSYEIGNQYEFASQFQEILVQNLSYFKNLKNLYWSPIRTERLHEQQNIEILYNTLRNSRVLQSVNLQYDAPALIQPLICLVKNVDTLKALELELKLSSETITSIPTFFTHLQNLERLTLHLSLGNDVIPASSLGLLGASLSKLDNLKEFELRTKIESKNKILFPSIIEPVQCMTQLRKLKVRSLFHASEILGSLYKVLPKLALLRELDFISPNPLQEDCNSGLLNLYKRLKNMRKLRKLKIRIANTKAKDTVLQSLFRVLDEVPLQTFDVEIGSDLFTPICVLEFAEAAKKYFSKKPFLLRLIQSHLNIFVRNLHNNILETVKVDNIEVILTDHDNNFLKKILAHNYALEGNTLLKSKYDFSPRDKKQCCSIY